MVARSIHVRLDEPAAAALSVIRGEGMNESEAVRTALREAAARRLARSSLRAEAAALGADAEDRAEMQEVRDLMAGLAPE